MEQNQASLAINPVIDIEFADYMLTAIVLAILLAISSLESLLSKAEPARASSYRLAATAAFFGLIYCVALAGAAEGDWLGDYEAHTIAVPLASMAFWLWFHYRASKTIAIEEYAKKFEERLETAVLLYVEQRSSEGESVDVYEVYKGCKESAAPGMLLQKELRFLRNSRLVGSLSDVLDQVGKLTYSPEKIEEILNNLVKRKRIRQQNGRYSVPQLPSPSGS